MAVFEKKNYTLITYYHNSMLEYRIRKGANNHEQSPVIFLIHGYGSNADDLFSFAPYLPKTHTIIALEAPLILSTGSYAWYQIYPKDDGSLDSELKEADKALALLNYNIIILMKENNLNLNDISVLGFSQGAILSWALAYSRPNKLRRIVALSGLIHKSIDTSKPPKFIAYAAHGINDMIIPVELARNSVYPLSQKYNEIVYHEFNDGHTVSQENFTKILTWLEKTNL